MKPENISKSDIVALSEQVADIVRLLINISSDDLNTVQAVCKQLSKKNSVLNKVKREPFVIPFVINQSRPR